MSYSKTFNENEYNEHLRYFKDKECTILHREDGPAIEYKNGTYKAWWVNGKIHREDGSAIEHARGDKSWWINSKLHREDGPAVEYSDGTKCYFLNDKVYVEKEYWAIIKLGVFV